MNLKRSLALALSLLMILSVIPAFGAGETLDRISGANRWETAVEISQAGWTNAGTVVLANGRNFPDALAGVSLAYGLDAPILLTEADSLVAETKAEIVRLGAAKVVILGGTGVISEDVADEIEDMGIIVDRISGADRYATAAAVAAKVAPAGADTVVLAYGRGYADALAAASYAAINGYPILLTEKNSLPEATEQAIEDLGATKVIVVGGTGVIAADTVAGLPGVTRVAGANREATSVALAEHFGLAASSYFLATGDGFADAITGAVLAAKEGTGILLVRSSFPTAVADFFADEEIVEAIIFGGTGVVSEAVATAAAAKLVPAGGTGVAGWTTAGATVTVDGKSAVAHATSGFYKITGVAPGTYTLTISMADHAPVTRTVKVVKDQISALNLNLAGALTQSAINIQGTVIDSANGAGLDGVVASAEVWNATTGKWVDAEIDGISPTGATGLFSIGNLKADGTTMPMDFGDKVKVTLTKAGFHTVSRELVLKTDALANVMTGFEMTAIKKMDVTGKITDANGNLATATVTVKNTAGTVTYGTIDTGADGTFSIADLQLLSGKYTITVTKAGYANYSATLNVTEGVDVVHNAVMQLGYNVTFNLRAQDIVGGAYGEFATGEFNAQLIKAGNVYASKAVTAPAAFPAAELVFEFTGNIVAPGTYTLRIIGETCKQTDYPLTVTNADVTANGRAVLASTIKGTTTVGGETIELINASNNSVVATQTLTATGTSYAFRNLAPGNYRVRVSKAGYQTQLSPVATDPAQALVNNEVVTISAVTLIANLTTGSNAGVLRTAGTYAPALNASIVYVANNKVDASGDPLEYIGTVDPATGAYSVGPMEPDVYTVIIRDPGNHENFVTTRNVAAGDAFTTVNYFLQPGGKAVLDLTVTNTADTVTLVDQWENSYTADASGNFVDLPAGVYTLTLVKAGFATIEATITVGANTTVTRTYTMVANPTPYAVSFGVTTTGHVSVDTATVQAVNEAGAVVASATTGATGLGSVSIPNGTYTLRVYKDGFYVGEQSVTVNNAAVDVPVIVLTAWE